MSVEVDLEKFAKELTSRIKRSVSLRDIKKIGNHALKMIKKRVRAGYGVDNKKRQRLKRLESTTIKARRSKRLSPFTSPRKSNATESGRMIGGLRVTSRTGLIKINPTGQSRSGIPNAEVAEHYSVERPFLDLTTSEEKSLKDFYLDKIIDLSKL